MKIKITFEGDKDYNKKIKTKYLWKKIKIEGLKTTQTSNYNDKIQLTIKAKKLTVNLKISKKKYKIKFKKGKATFKVNKYKLKKGKKYTLIFTKNSKLYKIDEKHTLKIKK